MSGTKITESVFANGEPFHGREGRDYLSELVSDIEQSLIHCRNTVALTAALTIPDISSKLEQRNIRGVRQNKIKQARYEYWFNSYVGDRYRARAWPPTGFEVPEEDWPPMPGVTGADAYALRNAIVHGAEFETPSHASRPHLDGFIFVAPTDSGTLHRCYDVLEKLAYLDITVFCRDIVDGFRRWETDTENDFDIFCRRKEIGKLFRL